MQAQYELKAMTTGERPPCAPNFGPIQHFAANWLIAVVCLFGLYCPTAIGAERMKFFLFAPLVVAACIYTALIIWYGVDRIVSLFALSSIAVLILCTLLTPLNDYTYGTFTAYLILAALLCLKLRSVSFGPVLMRSEEHTSEL